MAAAALTATAITRTGVAQTLAAATGDGNYFTNDGSQILVVYNGNAATRTITVATQATVDGFAVADATFTVAQGVTKIAGPWPRYIYNDANGYVQVTYSAVTDLTVGVFTLTAAGA